MRRFIQTRRLRVQDRVVQEQIHLFHVRAKEILELPMLWMKDRALRERRGLWWSTQVLLHYSSERV